MHYLLRLIVGLAVVLSISSCTILNSGLDSSLDLDTDFILEFKVDSDINPDDNNVPSPLFIRMYELKSDKAFVKATFLDLYEKEKDTLGGDLLVKHELKRLAPGEDADNKYVLAKDVRYVGIFAEFLQYEDASYKLIIPVLQQNVVSTQTVVFVSGNRLEIYLNPRDENGVDNK